MILTSFLITLLFCLPPAIVALIAWKRHADTTWVVYSTFLLEAVFGVLWALVYEALNGGIG